MRALSYFVAATLGVPLLHLVGLKAAKACTWSKTNYSSTGAIYQDYEPWGSSTSANCTVGSHTYTNGPGGGLQGNAGVTIAPAFDTSGHFYVRAIGGSASDGSGYDPPILSFTSTDTGNGCNGWVDINVADGLSTPTIVASGLATDANFNVVAWQTGSSDPSGEHIIYRESGHESWIDLTSATYLYHASGTGQPALPSAALSALVGANAVLSQYGTGTYPVVSPIVQPLTSCNYSTNGPPKSPLCIQVYDDASMTASLGWWASNTGVTNNPGAIQLTVDKTSSTNNLYALGNNSTYTNLVFQWISSTSSWTQLSTSVCGGGGDSFFPAYIAAKDTNVYGIQDTAVCGSGLTCQNDLEIAEYTTASGCWTFVDTSGGPSGFNAVATDESDTYGPAVWGLGADKTLYACY